MPLRLAAAGVFGYFGASGYSDRQTFDCERECPVSEYGQVRREFVTADIALGAAIVALAGAAWLFVRWRVPAPANAGTGGQSMSGVVFSF